MDWSQVFVIIGVNTALFGVMIGLFIGGFLYLSSKIDALSKEIQKNREEILWVKFRLDPNEHPHAKKEEELKEN